MDSIKHFLPKLDYLTNSDYMLTNDDIVHIYTPTHEILEYDKETNLRINGSLFQVVDIGKHPWLVKQSTSKSWPVITVDGTEKLC